MRTSLSSAAALLAVGCSQGFRAEGFVFTGDAPVDVALLAPSAVAPEAESDHPMHLVQDGGWGELVADPRAEIGLAGGGMVVADLDNDGQPDVFLLGPDAEGTRLLLQEDGAWRDVSATLPAIDWTGAIGGAAADVDSDGDRDVLVVFDGPNVLLLNDGKAGFSPSEDAGIEGPDDALSVGATFGDVDGDGYLDLLIANHGVIESAEGELVPEYPSALYINHGDGTFADGTANLPPHVRRGRPFLLSLVDVDGDALPELVSVQDVGQSTSDLYWNYGGHWVADQGALGSAGAGMGLGLGDVDDDGTPDFLQSSFRSLSLLESGPDYWSETAASTGLSPDIAAGAELGWGADLADLDNDGDLDAMVVFGAWSEMDVPAAQPDALYLRNADGGFEDVALSWDLADTAAGRGLVIADLDGDGWNDIVRRNLDAPATLHTHHAGKGEWVGVSLAQPGANPDAIGARVEVVTGKRIQTRWITAGGTGMFSSGPATAHVGVPGSITVDEVRVTWPDGSLSVIADVPANHQLFVRRL